jgi:hypothetical protein
MEAEVPVDEVDAVAIEVESVDEVENYKMLIFFVVQYC